MASKEDISDQIALTQKLNSVVTQMSTVMSRIESSFSNQIASVEKLTAAMEKLSGVDLGKIDASKLKDIQKEALITEKKVTSLTGRFKDLGSTLAKKFPNAAAASTAALSGIKQGFTSLLALGKGLGGFFLKTIGSLGSIAKSIIAIPFNIFGKLVAAAASGSGGISELMVAIENLRKEMGDLKGPGTKAVLETTKTLAGFKDTGLSAWRVFGTVAERLTLVTKVAVTMGSTFGMLRKEFEQNGGALLAFQKGLGVSDEQMKSIGDRAITIGKPMTKVFMDMTKQTLALGKAFDIDQKLIGKDMAKAMQNVKHFGALAVKEIAQASVYSRKLGVELDKITGTLDAFETFDSAAENAAKLSQAFGVNIDAFKLMEAQNPAEQLDMLRKSFRDAGVDASQFSRQQAKLLAQSTGLDEATVRQTFSSQNYGVSLDDVKKKSDAAQKKTMTQQEAMSKLADSIERLVKAGPQLENSFWKMFLKGMSAGIQSSGEFRGIMMNIRRSLQQVYMIGVQLGKLLPSLIPGLHDFLGGWKDLFTPKKWSGLYKGISGAAKQYLTGTSKDSVPTMLQSLKETFLNFFSLEGPSGQKIAHGFKDLLRFLSKLVSGLVPEISKGIASALEAVTKFIKDPKAALNAAKAGAGSPKAFAIEIFGPILSAFKEGYNILKPAVINMFNTLWTKIKKDYIENDEFRSKVRAILPSILETIGSIIFGPGLARGLLSFGVSRFGPALAASLAGGIAKAGTEKLLSKGVDKLTGAITGKVAASVAESAISGATTAGGTIASSATTVAGSVTTGMGAILASTTAAVIGVAGSAIVGAWAGWSIGKSLTGEIQDKKQEINETAENLYKVVNSSMSIAEKMAEADRSKALIKAQKKAIKEQGVFTNMWQWITNEETGEKTLANSEKLLKDLENQIDKGQDLERKATKEASAKKDKLDFLGPINLENAVQKMGDLEKLANKLKGPGFNFEKILGEVREKFKNIKFDLFDKTQTTDIESLSTSTQSIAEFIVSLTKISSESAKLKNAKISISGGLLTELVTLVFNLKGVATNILGGEGLGGIDLGKLTKGFDWLAEVMDNVLKLSGNATKLLTAKISIPSNISADLSAFSKTLSSAASSIPNEIGSNVSDIVKKFDGLGSVFDTMKETFEKIASSSSSLKKETLSVALSAVKEMVNKANEMNDVLSDGSLNKIDFSTKLGKVASAMGLGSKGSYTIKNRDVNITLNLQVSMSVDEVEKIMIMRKSSIIRNRLNFATSSETPEIPETYAKTLPELGKPAAG